MNMLVEDRLRERAGTTGQAGLTEALNVRIGMVAAIVVGELWGLMAALDAWLAGDGMAVGWILAFQLLCFAGAVVIWKGTPSLTGTQARPQPFPAGFADQPHPAPVAQQSYVSGLAALGENRL